MFAFGNWGGVGCLVVFLFCIHVLMANIKVILMYKDSSKLENDVVKIRGFPLSGYKLFGESRINGSHLPKGLRFILSRNPSLTQPTKTLAWHPLPCSTGSH
jgi:hypothetical protein